MNHRLSSRSVLRGVAIGALWGVAVAAAAELVRPRGGRAQLLDWDEVNAILERRLAGEPRLSAARGAELADRYRRLAAEVAGPLASALEAGDQLDLPPFQAVDRRGWAEVNVVILRETMAPLLESGSFPRSRLADLGRAGIDRYVALLLVFLSRRVLGQFDPQLLGKEPIPGGSLYLLESNIEAWERSEHLDGDDLRRWLILHESTHAWQFAAHPWLRAHLNRALEAVLAIAGGAVKDPVSRLLSLTVGMPAQWRALQQIQATMSLIEGYSNLVMNIAGREALPGFDRLEESYRRRSRKTGIEMLVWKVTGMDMKLRQYVDGERFARAIHAKHGMAVLNRAWDSAENLPRSRELNDPEAWYRRVVIHQPSGLGVARALPELPSAG